MVYELDEIVRVKDMVNDLYHIIILKYYEVIKDTRNNIDCLTVLYKADIISSAVILDYQLNFFETEVISSFGKITISELFEKYPEYLI